MQCLQCQTENKTGQKFCAACGQTLALPCPQCTFVNDPHDRFCGGCGQLLAPSLTPTDVPIPTPQSYTPPHLADKILAMRSALEGERKQVTVLFADIVGFSTLAGPLDPEDVHTLMDGCFELLTQQVHRYEGTINQFTGDGIMALFGAPLTHEDHAVCALHAALGIQKASTPVDKEWAQAALAWAWCRVGEPHRGMEVLAQMVPRQRAAHQVYGEIFALFLGEGYWLAGEYDKARQALAEHLRIAERNGMKFHIGAAHPSWVRSP